MTAQTASIVSDVARRYGGALFELALEKDALAEVAKDLSVVRSMAKESDDLRLLLESPAFAIDDKVNGLTEVARKAGLGELTVNFIGTVAQNGRAGHLLGAAIEFDTLYAKHRGIRRAIAITASALNADQQTKLESLLAESVGSDIELETRVDPSLVGGIQLKIGSTLIDASIAAKLNRMNLAMKGA